MAKKTAKTKLAFIRQVLVHAHSLLTFPFEFFPQSFLTWSFAHVAPVELRSGLGCWGKPRKRVPKRRESEHASNLFIFRGGRRFLHSRVEKVTSIVRDYCVSTVRSYSLKLGQPSGRAAWVAALLLVQKLLARQLRLLLLLLQQLLLLELFSLCPELLLPLLQVLLLVLGAQNLVH